MPTTLTTVTRQDAIRIQREIDAAVKRVLEANGLQASPSRSRYGARSFSYKVEAAVLTVGENGVNVSSREAQAFIAYAGILGIENPQAALGATFTARGVEYVLTGLNPRARKFPLMVTRVSDGRAYKLAQSAAMYLPGYDASRAQHGYFS